MDTAGGLLPGDRVWQGEPVPGRVAAVQVVTGVPLGWRWRLWRLRRLRHVIVTAIESASSCLVVGAAQTQGAGRRSAVGLLAGLRHRAPGSCTAQPCAGSHGSVPLWPARSSASCRTSWASRLHLAFKLCQSIRCLLVQRVVVVTEPLHGLLQPLRVTPCILE